MPIVRDFPLFPLGLVALPSELIPLHIFEERYKTMIGRCRSEGSEFGIVWMADDGLRTIGCACEIAEVLEELDDGRFALSPMGERLRKDVPGTMRGSAIARGELYYSAAAGFLASVRGEGTPYELAYGEPFFEHLGHNPELEALFQGSMAGRSAQEAADVVAAFRRVTPDKKRAASLLEPRGNAVINWISEPTPADLDAVRNCLK
jgi:Lon protease-like protein